MFGLLSVLKVRAILVGLQLGGQSLLRATGRWQRLAIETWCQMTSQRRAATMAQQRERMIENQRAVVGITWGVYQGAMALVNHVNAMARN